MNAKCTLRPLSSLFPIVVAAFVFLACALPVHATIFSQSIIDDAVAEPLLDFSNDLQNVPMEQAKAIYFMALAVHQDPNVKSPAGGTNVSVRLLAQIRSLITPNHEPNANGSLSGWTHGSIANAFVLVKNTPSVWSQLTSAEQTKIDWLMKAMAIAGHFCFDDGNNFLTGLGHEGNFSKTSNPNYREGYVGVVIAADLYFGSAALNGIYTNFSFDTYISQFQTYGWTNILSRWQSYNWKPILENGGSDGLGG